VAATVVGITGDVTRFANRDHFAGFNGTAPLEVSSGNRKVYRVRRPGSAPSPWSRVTQAVI
jgi:transposase